MPVARTALPLPSTSTDSAICVSAVLRSALAARVSIAASFRWIAYTKSALGERFPECGKASPVLLRRPDGQPDAAVEQRYTGVQILDQHAAAAHAFEHRGRIGNADQDEIRIARKNSDAGELAQLSVETLALGDDALRLRVERIVVREGPLGDRVRQRVDVVGRAHLVEF